MLMIAGAYVMFQTIKEYDEKNITDLLETMDPPFNSLTFSKPETKFSKADTWIADDESEIDLLLSFLKNYHVRKLKPEQINKHDDIDEFKISLEDSKGNVIKIIINEDLIVQNSLLYYEIVDGPLDFEWIVYFFSSNQIWLIKDVSKNNLSLTSCTFKN